MFSSRKIRQDYRMRTSDESSRPLGVNCSYFSMQRLLGGAYETEEQTEQFRLYFLLTMKQLYLKLALLLLLMSQTYTSKADEYEYHGLNYTVEKISRNTIVVYVATITSATDSLLAVGDIVIPSSFRGKVSDVLSKYINVRKIGSNAFSKESRLHSITIPNSVTSIGSSAFEGCSGLTTVVSEMEDPCTFGTSAFSGISETCTLHVTNGTKAAYIAKGWTEEVFKGGIIDAATSITFADTTVKNLCVANWDTDGDGELNMKEAAAVTTLGTVFKNNTKITSFDELQYFTGLTAIGENAFLYCDGLRSITIPNSVTSIGNYALYCSGLTAITIPNSVTSIGNYAFHNCNKLTHITLSSNISSIGEGIFDITAGYISPSFKRYVTININDFEKWCRKNFNNIFSIYDEIHLFYNGEEIKNLIIPDGITTINDYAFAYCTISSVTIPEGVKSIGQGAFMRCGLRSVTFPRSLTSIRYAAFYECTFLSKLIIPDLKSWCGIEFGTDFGEGKKYSFSWIDSGWGLYYDDDTKIENIVIPDGVTSISTYAFDYCLAKSITISHTVNSIGEKAFYRMGQLESITVEEGNNVYDSQENINAIIEGSTLLLGCKNTIIPSNVTTIEDGAFYSGTIGIPSTVKQIKYGAFRGTMKIFLYGGLSFEAYVEKTKWNTKTYGALETLSKGSTIYCWPDIYDKVASAILSNNTEVKLFDELTIKMTPTTARCITDNPLIINYGWISGGLQGDTETLLKNLEPNQRQQVSYYIKTEEYGTVERDLYIQTPPVNFTNQTPKVIKKGEAVVAAKTNLIDEESNVGFEWRKTDAPDDMKSKNGYGVIYKGQMEAVIKNLDPSSYYRVRPFYKSHRGKEYYGDWIAFDPSDFSYCEPTIHTYTNTKVMGNEVELTGYVVEGTENILEQGFEVWVFIITDTNQRRANMIGGVQTITATGQRMTASISNLEYNTSYVCRSYAKTSTKTYYGEEIIFTTGDDPTGIEDLTAEQATAEPAVEVARYNINGQRIAAPQKGVNIIRYSDGQTKKVFIK